MRLFLRKIAVFLVAAGLILGGATSHAAMASMTQDASLHEIHQIQHYADLAIDADDCAHATADTPPSPAPHTSHDDGLCKTCCTACMAADVAPLPPIPAQVLTESQEAFPVMRTALVAHPVSTDPGIPKVLI